MQKEVSKGIVFASKHDAEGNLLIAGSTKDKVLELLKAIGIEDESKINARFVPDDQVIGQ